MYFKSELYSSNYFKDCKQAAITAIQILGTENK